MVSLFIFASLQARQWSDRVIKRIVRPDWLVRQGRVRKEVHMMVTPRVVEEVRRHFNCSTLEGAELEDQGGEGITTLNYHSFVYLFLMVLFVCLFF
jgi:leishmanolysin-like peptidase